MNRTTTSSDISDSYHQWKRKSSTLNLDLPSQTWTHDWASDSNRLAVLYWAIRSTKPRVIVETGTFEGHGTTVMARAAHENNNRARLFTIDYDGDPTTRLPEEDWLALRGIREQNLRSAQDRFPECRIEFVEGDSRVVLGKVFPDMEQEWDFFYQDSMHFLSGIRAEWDILEPYASPGAIAVFDDVWPTRGTSRALWLSRCFPGWFARRSLLSGWSYFYPADGYGQFWVQKRH